jgi:hypothetical protein
LEPRPSTPIALGSIVNGTIGVSGEQDQFTFQMPTSGRVHFDSMTDNGSMFLDPGWSGRHSVSGRAFNNSDSFDIGNPVLIYLPEITR